ncbi:lysophospholipid acyltransferase LPEAT1 isoform X2 [Ricinus communis]|uniref:lysophospholipid acyltransferase LPEAT1 isoform X2 n=1 Tax=Ricinus communis TaxID=3988 RepID=UPI0007726EEE|nr:lysophospholipid acyltransferase LPEAT1 isoform X2 [Ricinus communis]|eukprot:XP_015575280.1 lysophospholipid acyltransferase LPEAT1 isoform X2 [Ricinus communis]
METELKNMNPDLSKAEPEPEPVRDEGTSKDDRPLLKSDSDQLQRQSIEELEKKFAAYVRKDIYGPMGRGELPLAENVLLGIALVTVVPIRIVLAITVLVLYYAICKICTLFSAPNRDEEEEQEDFAHVEGWRRAVIVWCGRLLSRAMLFVFGFYWIKETYRILEEEKEGKDAESEEEFERPGAIISNHVSYLDILYHMSSSFPSFVAKRSVAKLPLVGLISKCLGCVYVQRESKSSDFKGVAGVVVERVREAYENRSAPIMMLFPEGTTTNGDFLLPFKTGAFLAGAPVLPVILRYPYQRFSPAWDSISGARHVIFLLCQFVNCIEVTRLPIYYPSQEEKDDPKLYASNVRQLMAREGNLIMSDIGLAEKRVYHAALNGNNSLPSVLHQKDD